MKNRIFRLLTVMALFTAVIFGMNYLSGCKSSIVDDNSRPNPPSAPASPITISGNVKDAKTGAGLTGASVDILKTDGTKIATVVSGASGAFSYDLSSVTATSLKLSASATGYGYAFTIAQLDTAKKTAPVVMIPLDQVISTPVVVTTGGGTLSSATHTESKNSQPITITVPPGAVTQNTNIQMAALQVNNVPAPQNSNSTAQVGVASLSPQGVSFSAPVKLTFPLPYKFKPNDQITIHEMINGSWQSTSLTATVDNSGYIASVNISKTGQFALLDNTTVSGSVTIHKTSAPLEERTFKFSSGVLKVELPAVLTYTRIAQNVITEVPTDEWIFNTLGQRYGARFATAGGPGSTPSTVAFNVSWPGPAANPNKLNPDGSGNKYRPTESGDWSLKIIYESYTDNFASVQLNNPGYWQVTVSGSLVNWREKQRVWVWTAHNQGGVFEY